jgi:hypothetical protein
MSFNQFGKKRHFLAIGFDSDLQTACPRLPGTTRLARCVDGANAATERYGKNH